MLEPTPVGTAYICSLCDEPWEGHGDRPTVLDCIRLLKARIFIPQITTTYWWPTYTVPQQPYYWTSTPGNS